MSFGANYNIYKETIDPDLKIKSLLDEETARINSKEKKVNTAHDTKKRQDLFTKNQTARSNANLRMFLTVAITIVLSLFCVYLDKIFPGTIPESVTDILVTIIIIAGVIYWIMQYIDLQRRDELDYDKINFGYLLKKPEPKSELTAGESSTETNITSVSQKECVGSECCTGTLIYNSGTGKCQAAAAIEPFTPLPEYTIMR